MRHGRGNQHLTSHPKYKGSVMVANVGMYRCTYIRMLKLEATGPASGFGADHVILKPTANNTNNNQWCEWHVSDFGQYLRAAA